MWNIPHCVEHTLGCAPKWRTYPLVCAPERRVGTGWCVHQTAFGDSAVRMTTRRWFCLQIGHMRHKMPALIGQKKAQKKLMLNIRTHFEQVGSMH